MRTILLSVPAILLVADMVLKCVDVLVVVNESRVCLMMILCRLSAPHYIHAVGGIECHGHRAGLQSSNIDDADVIDKVTFGFNSHGIESDAAELKASAPGAETAARI